MSLFLLAPHMNIHQLKAKLFSMILCFTDQIVRLEPHCLIYQILKIFIQYYQQQTLGYVVIIYMITKVVESQKWVVKLVGIFYINFSRF